MYTQFFWWSLASTCAQVFSGAVSNHFLGFQELTIHQSHQLPVWSPVWSWCKSNIMMPFRRNWAAMLTNVVPLLDFNGVSDCGHFNIFAFQYGWTTPINYSAWSITRPFYLLTFTLKTPGIVTAMIYQDPFLFWPKCAKPELTTLPRSHDKLFFIEKWASSL